MFGHIKSELSIRQVVERYGVKLNHNKALCPFHQEKNKSFSISDRKQLYKCHTCNDKAGDLISFVSKMFALKPIDACKKLNEDFSLGLGGKLTREQKIKTARRKAIMSKRKLEDEAKKEKYFNAYSVFGEYDKICINNKPKRYEEPNNLWIFANGQREYWWDKIMSLELI